LIGRAVALVCLLASSAYADLPLKVIEVPAPIVAAPQTVRVLYFNRCIGGCTIFKGGSDDVRTRNSVVPEGPEGSQYTLSQFAWSDQVWNDTMQCLREVYSPYNIEITDTVPVPGTPYNEGLIAGSASELNTNGFFGVAAINGDCTSRAFAMSFTMSNDIGPDAQTLCYVAAQETAHSFGLGHSFEYLDGRSACNDPMSYRTCGGQRFFRNEQARCGDFVVGQCRCGGFQNTHQTLVNVLGVGTPITAPPTLTVTSPVPDAAIANGSSVVARATAQRGIHKMELYLNGYKWTEVKGSPWGNGGQPETSYALVLPPEVPDGVIDIVVRAKDDIDVSTDSPTITVTKGAPCTSADTCADGQLCDAGRCFWEPPVGVLGDECSFQQFCMTELCQAIDGGESRCTQGCVLGLADACPTGYECIANSETGGVCWPASDLKGNCLGCSNSREGSLQGLLFVLGLGFLVLRRPRRRR
jgi:hypothetical protein